MQKGQLATSKPHTTFLGRNWTTSMGLQSRPTKKLQSLSLQDSTKERTDGDGKDMSLDEAEVDVGLRLETGCR